MERKTSRIILIGLAVIVMAGTIILMAPALRSNQAIAAIIGAPNPRPTLGPNETPFQTPDTESEQMANWPPSDLAQMLAGTTLSRQTHDYILAPDSPDPTNGQAVLGEIWIALGEDSHPVRFHGEYRLEDGTFLQDIHQIRDGGGVQGTTVLSPVYGERSRCRTNAIPLSHLYSALPQFMERASLNASGFELTGLRDPVVELSIPSRAATLDEKQRFGYLTDSMVREWVKEVTGAGGDGDVARVTTLQLGASNILLVETSRLLSSDGEVIAHEERARGPVGVYDDSQVPPDVWTLSDPAKEICE